MSDDPVLTAVQKFMDAVSERITKQDQRIGEQNTEIRSLREELQTRSAPVITPEHIEKPKDGKDGVSVAGASIREGRLFLRYSDGREDDLGAVVGIDGKDGKDGVDGKDGIDGKAGNDGLDGKDGADGIATRAEIESLVNTAVETRYADIVVRSIADSYQDVFKQGETYSRGAFATWDGSLWLSMRDTKAQPGTQDSGWKLVTKRGRDGRDKR